MMMELRHLRYFLAVAEEGHFTRAAQRLGIGQPPLSQQIKDLEQEIGVKLFFRLPRGAELTPAGAAFAVEAQAILAAADRAKDAAQRAACGESGRLALGFTGSSSFTSLLRETIRGFRCRWPGVTLALAEMNTILLLDKVRRGDLDAAFIRPGVQDPVGMRLIRAPDEAMLVALPVAHRLAGQAAVALQDLAEETLILFPRAAGLSLYDEISAALLACGVDPVVDQEVPQMSSVINLVAADLGVSIVTASMAQICLSGVVYRPIKGIAPRARLALAVPAEREDRVVSRLITLVEELIAHSVHPA
jgi:DNA-binding transcriptional LysR family regulator